MSDEKSRPDEKSIPDEKSRPDEKSVSGEKSMPDEKSRPDEKSIPDEKSMPDEKSIPDEKSMPDEKSRPDEKSMSDEKSIPDEKSMPDDESSPDDEWVPDSERMADEESQSDSYFQNQTPVYTFLESSPLDEYAVIARMHRKEAKQLVERAHQAQDEGRDEEAKLLMDLSIKWVERAEEFEKAARGEGGDPIVAEILDSQDEMIQKTSIKYTPQFITTKDIRPPRVPKHMRPPPPGPIARAVTWIKRKFKK